MPGWLESVKRALASITEVLLLLVALGIVVQVLFGATSMSFIGANVVSNLVGLIKSLGDAGIVGLIAVGVIIWLFSKRQLP